MKKILPLVLTIISTNVLFSQISIGFENEKNQKDSLQRFSISGFIDSYYQYNTNNPGLYGNWGTIGLGRVLDGEHNQLAFNMFQTKLEYTNKDLYIVGDLAFGPGAEKLIYGNIGTSQIIKQAYIAYTINKATFTVGQFSTFIGYEMMDAPENTNYSLSTLFAFGPYYHTGAKLDYAISDKLGVMVGVLNGWDKMKDDNTYKTMATQISVKPSDNFELNMNWIGGNEEPSYLTGDTIDSFKQLVDLSISTNISKKFSVGINSSYGFYDYEGSSQKNWGGAALYLKYVYSNNNAFGLRAEFFEDISGVQGLNASYTGYTVTYIKTLADGHLFVKPEIRYDNASQKIYFKGNNSLSTSQLTIGLAVVAKF